MLSGVASVFVACLAVAGCYTDHINSAPVAHIVVITGDADDFHIPDDPWPKFSCATSTDPDGETPKCNWEFFTCPRNEACLPHGFALNKESQVDLQLNHELPHAPVKVVLTVTDGHGATATDTLLVDPKDTAPSVTVVEAAGNLKNRHSNYSVGRELTVQATPSDPDRDSPSVKWKIVSMPSGAAPEEHDLPVTDAGGFSTYRHVLRPDKPGVWKVQGTADDGFGETATSTIELTVEEDLPPCIQAREPDAPVGFSVVVGRAGGVRTFRVDSVEDEFRSYPFTARPDDRSREATFRWSIGPEGQVPAAVPGQVTNVFALDPSTLPLGDRLVVRVDVGDGVERACADDAATCAAGPEDSCSSRYSWTVEVR